MNTNEHVQPTQRQFSQPKSQTQQKAKAQQNPTAFTNQNKKQIPNQVQLQQKPNAQVKNGSKPQRKKVKAKSNKNQLKELDKTQADIKSPQNNGKPPENQPSTSVVDCELLGDSSVLQQADLQPKAPSVLQPLSAPKSPSLLSTSSKRLPASKQAINSSLRGHQDMPLVARSFEEATPLLCALLNSTSGGKLNLDVSPQEQDWLTQRLQTYFTFVGPSTCGLARYVTVEGRTCVVQPCPFFCINLQSFSADIKSVYPFKTSGYQDVVSRTRNPEIPSFRSTTLLEIGAKLPWQESDTVQLKHWSTGQGFKKKVVDQSFRYMVAFANGHGGRLFAGVDDDHVIHGYPTSSIPQWQQCYEALEKELEEYEPRIQMNLDFRETNDHDIIVPVFTAYPSKNFVCKKDTFGYRYEHGTVHKLPRSVWEPSLRLSFNGQHLETLSPNAYRVPVAVARASPRARSNSPVSLEEALIQHVGANPGIISQHLRQTLHQQCQFAKKDLNSLLDRLTMGGVLICQEIDLNKHYMLAESSRSIHVTC